MYFKICTKTYPRIFTILPFQQKHKNLNNHKRVAGSNNYPNIGILTRNEEGMICKDILASNNKKDMLLNNMYGMTSFTQ